MHELSWMLAQAGGAEGISLIVWVVAGLAALWIVLKVFKLVTGLFARIIWIAALLGAVVWVVLILAEQNKG